MPRGKTQTPFNAISSIKKLKEDTEPNIILLLVPVTGFGLIEPFKFIRVPEKL
jgi:hypothetical protein